MAGTEYAKGLEGVVAAESEICKIDGENGKLYYLGYSIEDLVEHCSFEEVTYLLLYGDLPKAPELEGFSRRMRDSRTLPEPVRQMIREFPRDSHPMELLQSVIAYLSSYVEHKIHHGPNCNCRDTLHQLAQLPGVVAGYHRVRNGQEILDAREDLNHGANFLYLLFGKEPEELEAKIMDNSLTLHAEHSLNASTFTARVVASTMSTCYCSISAAVGALFGHLHGGANEKVMNMVEEIGTKDRVKDWVNKALDEKRKIMGMGHRVYRAKDPRAKLMEQYLYELSEKYDDWRYYEILKTVESTFRERMEEKGKPIYPNVDFFSGAVYSLLGIPKVLFTPIFAIARAAGWLSHILEQRSDNRIFRPKAAYVGAEGRELEPLSER
jgi:citrate synthase